MAAQWKKTAGPGSAVFAGANSLETAVTLPKQKGTYTFELSADNGFDTAKDTVSVVVNQPPVFDVNVFNTDPANAKKRVLSVQVADNGLGNPQQDALTFAWKKVTGAEPVVFQPDPANVTNTTVTFPKAGNYTLEVTMGNGTAFVVKKTVTVTVA